jgi:hypothetical protein
MRAAVTTALAWACVIATGLSAVPTAQPDVRLPQWTQRKNIIPGSHHGA